MKKKVFDKQLFFVLSIIIISGIFLIVLNLNKENVSLSPGGCLSSQLEGSVACYSYGSLSKQFTINVPSSGVGGKDLIVFPYNKNQASFTCRAGSVCSIKDSQGFEIKDSLITKDCIRYTGLKKILVVNGKWDPNSKTGIYPGACVCPENSIYISEVENILVSKGKCVKCTDNDKDSYFGESAICSKSFLEKISKFDCNDNNGGIKPGQSEICNGIDDNCDGIVDEGCWELTFENVLGYEYQPVNFIIPNLEFKFKDDSTIASNLIGLPPEDDVYHEIYLENKDTGKIYESELKLQGNTRRSCYPFNMNIKFDRYDLFHLNGNGLGYKKLRFMPECAGMQNNLKWTQPVEYINYNFFKQLGFKEMDIIGFVSLSYLNHDEQVEDWKEYLLIQRTSENDDEISFLEQYHLVGRNANGDLYEVGKTAGIDDLDLDFDWDGYTELTDKDTGEIFYIDEPELNMYLIITNFFNNWDTLTNNLKFAKEQDSDLFHIIPFDFDASLNDACYSSNSNGFMTVFSTVWRDSPNHDVDNRIRIYNSLEAFYTNNENLLSLFQYVDEYPFLSNKDKSHLKKVLMLRFAQGNLIYGNNDFLLRLFTQNEIDQYSITPFRNVHHDFFQNIVDSVEQSDEYYCLE